MKIRLNVKKIKREMERSGWNVEQLAKEMKVTRTYVYHYFTSSANPTLKTVEKFAKALDLDPKDILI